MVYLAMVEYMPPSNYLRPQQQEQQKLCVNISAYVYELYYNLFNYMFHSAKKNSTPFLDLVDTQLKFDAWKTGIDEIEFRFNDFFLLNEYLDSVHFLSW